MGFNFPSTPTIGDLYPVPPTAGVPQYRWDGEKWTATTVDTTTLPATLAEAMAFNAIQINGGMEVNQEYGNGVVTPGWTNYQGYACDGWFSDISIAAMLPGFSVGTVDSSGGGTLGNLGIPWCLGITATGAATFSDANDRASLYQLIEGTRFSRLGMGYPNAQPVTVSFWIWTTRPGTGCMILGSYGAQQRYHIKEYVVTAANEWQYKTLTFPPETSPPENWPTGNTAASILLFNFGCGSTAKGGVADTWADWTTQYATANQTNFFAATNDAVYITGVTILPGTQGPTAAQSHLATRPYATELAICQRYLYYRVAAAGEFIGISQAYNSQNIYGLTIPLPVTMRATPTVSVSSATHFIADNAAGVQNPSFTSMIAAALGPHAIQISDLTGSSGFVAGDAASTWFGTAGAWIRADARFTP